MKPIEKLSTAKIFTRGTKYSVYNRGLSLSCLCVAKYNMMSLERKEKRKKYIYICIIHTYMSLYYIRVCSLQQLRYYHYKFTHIVTTTCQQFYSVVCLHRRPKNASRLFSFLFFSLFFCQPYTIYSYILFRFGLLLFFFFFCCLGCQHCSWQT